MRTKNIILILLLSHFCFMSVAKPHPLWKDKGRIVLSSDGNEHDWDDWAASAMTLAIIASQGLQDNVTLYTYSDHIWGSNQERDDIKGMCAYNHMRESVLGGAKYFGYNKTRFICAVDNAEVAYNAMRDEINKSSADNPLYILAAGPMQVVGEGMNRAEKDKLQYVTVISHSNWNNNHSDKPDSSYGKYSKVGWDNHSGWIWDEMIAEFGEGKQNAQFIKIKDQNHGWGKYIALQCERKHFDWLKTSKKKKEYLDGSWEWLYTRLESCAMKNETIFDVSDTGLVCYLLSGDEEVSPQMMQEFMENKK